MVVPVPMLVQMLVPVLLLLLVQLLLVVLVLGPTAHNTHIAMCNTHIAMCHHHIAMCNTHMAMCITHMGMCTTHIAMYWGFVLASWSAGHPPPSTLGLGPRQRHWFEPLQQSLYSRSWTCGSLAPASGRAQKVAAAAGAVPLFMSFHLI
jgi:hypothetical protein